MHCQVRLGNARRLESLRGATVSLAVDVDLSSAVVSYRPAAGVERSASAGAVSAVALLQAAPWRTFRWYFGQRHYPGVYWSATQRDHVIYESRLELANLLLADFDPAVRQIVAQPFLLSAEVDGRLFTHIPDYLLGTDGEPVVVDVVRGERMVEPEIIFLCAWTRQIVESLGWSYVVENEPPRIRLANVRFVAGYRREWLINTPILNEMRSRSGQFAGMSIADAEQSVRPYPQQVVRPALMHLLWCHEYCVELDDPLRPSTVLEAPR
jgi:hypothetical protein